MLSAKMTSMENRVRHNEDMYKQELREKDQLESSIKELEIKKLRLEKDHQDCLSSYTRAISEIKHIKSSNKKLSQERVDKKVVEDYEKKLRKMKKSKEEADNSLKDFMKQNADMRTTNFKLNDEIEQIKKEKQECLTTYLELINQTYDGDATKGLTKNADLSQRVQDQSQPTPLLR